MKMPRKTKKAGWIYGTLMGDNGGRMEAEMPATRFIGIAYASLSEADRGAIRADIAETDKKTAIAAKEDL